MGAARSPTRFQSYSMPYLAPFSLITMYWGLPISGCCPICSMATSPAGSWAACCCTRVVSCDSPAATRMARLRTSRSCTGAMRPRACIRRRSPPPGPARSPTCNSATATLRAPSATTSSSRRAAGALPAHSATPPARRGSHRRRQRGHRAAARIRHGGATFSRAPRARALAHRPWRRAASRGPPPRRPASLTTGTRPRRPLRRHATRRPSTRRTPRNRRPPPPRRA